MESIWSFVLSKTPIACEMDKTWWNPVSFSSFISKSCDSKLAWCSCTDPGMILMDSSFSSLLIHFRSVWTSCSALSVKVERVCLMSEEKRPSEATQVIRSLNIHVVIKLWAGLQNPWPAGEDVCPALEEHPVVIRNFHKLQRSTLRNNLLYRPYSLRNDL